MAPKSPFQPGDRVRLNLPGSKIHGTVGTLKNPRPPAGWWLVEADRPLELDDGQPDEDRSFIAPDLWLERAGPKGPIAGVRGEALPPALGESPKATQLGAAGARAARATKSTQGNRPRS